MYIPCVRADFYVDPNVQGIKFRDFVSVVCTSNWNGSPARAKLDKGKNSFELLHFVPILYIKTNQHRQIIRLKSSSKL